MAQFIPGLQLNGAFFEEIVGPLLQQHLPDMPYTAALIGWGSDVLGYDTAQSTDHHWGPRLLLFLPEAEFAARREAVDALLRAELPLTFRGFSTNFTPPQPNGVRLLAPIDVGPVNHMIEIRTLRELCEWYVAIDPDQELTTTDWLTIPEQRLLGMTAGDVFHDASGELTALRTRLAYYPDAVWRYLLAAQWQKIAQEEPFVGRCGDVGDEVGSRLVATRLVEQCMKLCFLLERRYAPYSKWFGTAWKRLPCAAQLAPVFEAVLAAVDWRTRERELGAGLTMLAEFHNRLQITPPVPTEVVQFHTRPYHVIDAGRFAVAIVATITDPEVAAIKPLIGAIDQYVDSTDVKSDVRRCRRLATLYAEAGR